MVMATLKGEFLLDAGSHQILIGRQANKLVHQVLISVCVCTDGIPTCFREGQFYESTHSRKLNCKNKIAKSRTKQDKTMISTKCGEWSLRHNIWWSQGHICRLHKEGKWILNVLIFSVLQWYDYTSEQINPLHTLSHYYLFYFFFF